MAKNIKAIKCPNCGSVKKTEIKPDYFVCQNCDTEYFLDDDDINININHTPNPSVTNQSPDLKKSVPFIVIGLVFLIIYISFLFPKSSTKLRTVNEQKEKYDFSVSADFIYPEAKTGKAILLRIARENIREKNGDYTYVNTHAVFIDPIKKSIIKDVVLFEHTRRLDDYDVRFKVENDGNIYVIYHGPIIYKLDTEHNKLVDYTKTIFKNHPELSAGVAKIDAYSGNNYWSVLSNDGENYYYFPGQDILTQDYKEQYSSANAKTNNYFTIEDSILSKIISTDENGDKKTEVLNENKKLFDGKINYQDKTSLIISTNTNASDESPTMLQRIDVNTGKTLWSLPAKTMDYDDICRCKEGFAVQYSSGEKLDYISGVYIISEEGKILYDYMIGRNE